MAFLKSSQLSLGPKTIDVKGFTQAETLKLGDRAYTEHEVLLADNYNIVGDVTVSEDLILSKLSDDGDAITLTGDTTTRTITGSGTIQGATLAQTPNATLTGMTGELGSAVQDGITRLGSVTTGNLSNTAIVYPAGHVIKIQENVFATSVTTTTTTYIVACASDNFTVLNATSTLYISGHFQWNTTNANSKIKITYSTNNFSSETQMSISATLGVRNNNAGLIDMLVPFSGKLTHGLGVGTGIKFRVYVNRYQGSGTITVNQYDVARIRIMEVM